jgi:hypothetical protein
MLITFSCIVLYIALAKVIGEFYYTLESLDLIEGSSNTLSLIYIGLLIVITALRYYLVYKAPRRRYRNTVHDNSDRLDDEYNYKESLINRYKRNREGAEERQRTYMNYCPYCNAEIEYSFVYCPKCGKVIR